MPQGDIYARGLQLIPDETCRQSRKRKVISIFRDLLQIGTLHLIRIDPYCFDEDRDWKMRCLALNRRCGIFVARLNFDGLCYCETIRICAWCKLC